MQSHILDTSSEVNLLVIQQTQAPSKGRCPFPAGGTRFIGVYLARQLLEQGHDVTLLTRGKSPVTFQIPDDTDASFKQYADSVKHIASDRKDEAAVKEKLGKGGFEGAHLLLIGGGRETSCGII